MKRGYIISIILLMFIILSLSNSSGFLSSLAVWNTCKDGTSNNQCSKEQPFLCQEGELIRNCSLCGCGPGYLCNSQTNECELSDFCEQGQGICQASCENGNIEFVPLTESCNAGEMINNNIILAGDSLTLKLTLENTNNFASISEISAIAYIEGLLESGEGFFLDTLEPKTTFEKDLILKIPEDFDKIKSYKLIFNIAYQDKQEQREFNINFQGDRFVFTMRDVNFLTEGTEVELSQDLKYSIKIINRKCCVSPNIKTTSSSFVSYCDNKVPYNSCSIEKPLYCDNGLLIEDCLKCGCPNNFLCNKDRKCENIVINKEVEKFFDIVKAEPSEQPILRFIGYKLARVAKSPLTPEAVAINKGENAINVKTKDVDLEVSSFNNQTPKIAVEITGY